MHYHLRVEDAYCVNKLRQNVSLETWIWHQIVTSQTVHKKYKWPPYACDACEWTPTPWKFYACATAFNRRILRSCLVPHCSPPPALTLPSTTPCRRVRSQLFLSPTPVLFQEVGILILDRQLRHSNTASLTSITQFTNVIWHHVVLRLILIVDWWVAMVVDWCPAVHDTSGATAPLSHVGNWCELYYFLQTFTKIHIMIVVASNTKKGIWESWSWNTNKTVVGSNPVCSKCADSCRTRVLKSGCCTPLSRCELWLDACIQHQRRVFLSTHGSNLLSFVVKEPHYI